MSKKRSRFDGVEVAVNLTTEGDVTPSSDNADSLGSSVKRYKQVTAVTENISTSQVGTLNVGTVSVTSAIQLNDGISSNYAPVITNGLTPPVIGTLAPLGTGQILIGSLGNPPVAAQITGTTNRVDVNSTDGAISISAPQDIATTSSPTFAAVSLKGATPSVAFQANGTGHTTTVVATTPSADRTITFPDPTASANVIYDVKNQTMTGQKSFSAAPVFGNGFTSQNGLSGNLMNVTVATPTASVVTVTLPDPGHSSANFMLDGMGNPTLVVQTTNISTAVTNNARAGSIQMFAGMSNNSTTTFTLNNAFITANSTVLLWTTAISTGNVTATATVSAIASGSCSITVTNRDPTNNISNGPGIYFIVF